MSPTIRRKVWFAGRVQGVGFRYTACDAAAGFAVVGYVRNLSDGRVELVAEGEPAEIDRFVAVLHDRMRRYITDVRQVDEAPTGEFRRFGVAYE